MTAARVAVVVLNWRNADDTVATLESVMHASSDATLVVVDNGSNDGSDAYLREWCRTHGDRITFIALSENRGFTGGCNVGVRRALESAPDYVLFLNNDALVPDRGIETLVAVARQTNAGIVGARVTDFTGERELFARHVWPARVFGLGQASGEGAWWESADVDGAAMLVSAELCRMRLSEQGFVFDDAFFLYWEDVDLCRWALSRGYRCVVAGDCVVRHKVAASSGGRLNPRSYYYGTRNRIAIANRWLPFLYRVAFHLYYAPTRLLIAALRVRKNRLAARALLRGLIDGYRGRSGRVEIDC